MRTLYLHKSLKSGLKKVEFPIERVYNLGFTIRDQEKMQAHLDEVAKEGVPPPSTDTPPIIFPISPWATITDTVVPVQYGKTSGEIEIVTLSRGDETYVGVGSDHTDRELEAINIPWSKQVAPNVMSPIVWSWEEVEPHWDQVQLESYVSEDGTRHLYQKASVAEFWTPIEMRDSLDGRIKPVKEGFLVLFSGTVVSMDGRLSYSREWTISMIDPVLERRIDHMYKVIVLSEEVFIP
jgi:4-hydroxyphenylacetate 3-monooxygenase